MIELKVKIQDEALAAEAFAAIHSYPETVRDGAGKTVKNNQSHEDFMKERIGQMVSDTIRRHQTQSSMTSISEGLKDMVTVS